MTEKHLLTQAETAVALVEYLQRKARTDMRGDLNVNVKMQVDQRLGMITQVTITK